MKKYYSISLLLLLLFCIYSCKSPFDTNTTEKDIFQLDVSHNITRVMPSGLVLLNWSEITINRFSFFRIERKTYNDTSWTLVNELTEPMVTTYIDTILDDENLLYRVGIVDKDDNIIWSEGSTDVPKTKHVIVPDEFLTIQPAINSKLLDSGDSIFVRPGEYRETIYLAEKDILIKSTQGYQNTFLFRTTLPDSIDQLRVVNILSGILDGFSVRQGVPMHGSGGGISMGANATVQNCYVESNFANAYKNGGYGGGVFISDDANLYNNIITNNGCTRPFSKGIYALSAHGEIINNTIVENDIMLSGDCKGLIFRNNIVYNSQPDLTFEYDSSKTNVAIDYNIFDQDIDIGTDNILGDPNFIDNSSFLLSPNSPAIDSGHPDSKYNDTDGTRNDIGAYGGPQNKK